MGHGGAGRGGGKMGSGVGMSVGAGVGGWVPTDYDTGGWGWLGNEVKTIGDEI